MGSRDFRVGGAVGSGGARGGVALGREWGDPFKPLPGCRQSHPTPSPSPCARAGSWASCLGRCSIPLIGLHLSVSPSRQHVGTAASRLIFLIHRSAHLFPPPRSPRGSIVRAETSPAPAVEQSQGHPAWAPPTLQPCPPRTPSHPLTREKHLILGPVHSFLCTLAHAAPSWGCRPRGPPSVPSSPLTPWPQLGRSSWGAPGVCPQRGASRGLAAILGEACFHC